MYGGAENVFTSTHTKSFGYGWDGGQLMSMSNTTTGAVAYLGIMLAKESTTQR